MKTTNHTPGPWIIDRGQIRDTDGNSLASVPYSLGGTQDCANARLIAAAPDMFDALQGVVDYLETFVCHDEQGRIALSKAQETIAKAKGESK